ncbi:porin [Colwellia piezophila]|uniref:porin n=1 Tax=Colwellia piezophila TaxID=211668 RepID=UPI00036E1458|nr:porin [Colwellia piezophila]
MNKQKILVILLLTFLPTMSYAEESFALNMYGVGHLSLDNVDDGIDSSMYVASNSSRFGISGNYQLMNELKVIFQYESGIDLTGQGGNDGNGGADYEGQFFTKTRPSFVGLSGSFGTTLIGHMPALDQWANDYNLFADQVGDLGNLWEGSGIPGRMDNVVYYATPDMKGFDFAVTYTPEEGQKGSANVILKANYARGDLKLGFAYGSIGQPDANKDQTVAAFTLGYNFERYSIGGGYQMEFDIAGLAGNDRGSFSLGGSMKLSDKGTLKAQFAVSDGEFSQSEATQIAVGYDYALNDNATIYLAYARMENDDMVNFSVNGKGHGDKVIPMLGNDPSAISLGIVAKFDVNFFK